MATTRTAQTHWEGSLFEGAGKVTLESSGLGTYDVSWPARAEEPNGKTSPEELIAAAHSACFSMALSNGLAKAGTPPTALDTKADVEFTPGTGITGIHLTVTGAVDGMSGDDFVAAAEDAKANCPVSQALTGTTITLSASLALPVITSTRRMPATGRRDLGRGYSASACCSFALPCGLSSRNHTIRWAWGISMPS
jgi:osmotically inducible protein OsmC